MVALVPPVNATNTEKETVALAAKFNIAELANDILVDDNPFKSNIRRYFTSVLLTYQCLTASDYQLFGILYPYRPFNSAGRCRF